MLPTFSEQLNNLSHTFSLGMADIGSVHPLIVHFPIVLLFIAPLFIIAGCIFKTSFKSFLISAAILMLLGAVSILLAVESGELAAENLAANPAYVETIEIHYELAEQSRLIFCVLTAIYLLFLIFNAQFVAKFGHNANSIFLIVFLISYILALVLLANAAHYGGKLVHKYDIHSKLYSTEK